jgi:hypothetical protein
MIQSFGWGKEVLNSYIKVGMAFAEIDISKLVRIEPRTLFKITASKRFIKVVDGIKNSIGHITQQFVENLIDSCKAPRKALPDKPSIWRSEKDGSRTCVVPPIKENDHFTGTSIQRAMDVEGISAQSFVREAAAFREAWECGAFQLVGELPPHLQAILGDKLDYPAPTSDDVEVETPSEQATAAVEVEVDDTSNVREETVEVINENTAAPFGFASPTERKPILLASSPQIQVVISNDFSQTENSTEPVSAEEIATQLRRCQTWSEITTITETLDKATRIESWAMLDKSEQQRILDIKSATVAAYQT